jgi:hypothetical protein
MVDKKIKAARVESLSPLHSVWTHATANENKVENSEQFTKA